MKRSQAYRLIASWLLAGDAPAPPPPGADWKTILETASNHQITPGLGWHLRNAAWVPGPVAEYLDGVLYLNRDRNTQLHAGLAELCTQMSAIGLQPLLLKGSGLLGGDLLPDRGYRILGDLDLLLPDAQSLAATAELLTAQGYAWQASEHEHQLPMAIHPRRGFGVEAHHAVAKRPWGDWLDQQAIFARAEPVALGNGTALVPAPADRMAIAMLHGLFQDGYLLRGIPSLRLIGDIALHLAAPGGDDAFAEARATLDRVGPGGTAAVAAMLDPAAPVPRHVARALDSRLQHWRHGLTIVVGRFPDFLQRSRREQREALSIARWRERFTRHFSGW